MHNVDGDIHGQRLFCGDALDFLASMPSSSARLVLSSPPYDIGKAYEGRQGGLEQWLEGQRSILNECCRTLVDGGSLCWQVGSRVERRRDGSAALYPVDALLFPVMLGMGLVPRNRVIWTFGHGMHCRQRLSGRYESMLWMTKGDGYLIDLDAVRVPSKYPGKRHFKGPRRGQLSGNPLGKNPSDVWDIVNVKANHPEKTSHPCQFPLSLAERAILAFSARGETVLDPYAGSGTTLVAALRRGRKGMGSELEPTYCAIAEGRLKAEFDKSNGVCL